MGPLIIDVTLKERASISNVANILLKAFGHYEHPDYISALHLNAFQLLPERIAGILSRFGTDFSRNQYGALVFRGLNGSRSRCTWPYPALVERNRLQQAGEVWVYLFPAAWRHSLQTRTSIMHNEKAVACCMRSFPMKR